MGQRYSLFFSARDRCTWRCGQSLGAERLDPDRGRGEHGSRLPASIPRSQFQQQRGFARAAPPRRPITGRGRTGSGPRRHAARTKTARWALNARERTALTQRPGSQPDQPLLGPSVCGWSTFAKCVCNCEFQGRARCRAGTARPHFAGVRSLSLLPSRTRVPATRSIWVDGRLGAASSWGATRRCRPDAECHPSDTLLGATPRSVNDPAILLGDERTVSCAPVIGRWFSHSLTNSVSFTASPSPAQSHRPSEPVTARV